MNTFKTKISEKDIILDIPISANKVVKRKTCDIIWTNDPIRSGSHIMTILNPSVTMIICKVYFADASGNETDVWYGYHYLRYSNDVTYEIDKRGVEIDDDIRPWQVEVGPKHFKVIF